MGYGINSIKASGSSARETAYLILSSSTFNLSAYLRIIIQNTTRLKACMQDTLHICPYRAQVLP
jgi:hypothetical protein